MPDVIVFSDLIERSISLIWDAFFGSNLKQSHCEKEAADGNFLPKHQILGIQVVPADIGQQTLVGNEHPVDRHPGYFFASDCISNTDCLARNIFSSDFYWVAI